MSKEKTVRLDQTFTSTRPDLQVGFQLPGAYIIKDGVPVPDLNDEAMAKRVKNVERRVESDEGMKEESKEEKTEESKDVIANPNGMKQSDDGTKS